MAKNGVKVAVAGATGAVGQQMIACLEQRHFPVESIRLLASARSMGRELRFNNQKIAVEELTADSFNDMDIALLSLGDWCNPNTCEQSGTNSLTIDGLIGLNVVILEAMGELPPISLNLSVSSCP